VRILRQEAAKVGLKPGFSILDAADTTALFQELAGNVDKGRLRALQSRISLWKNQLVEPAAALKDSADDIESAARKLYADYERTLRAYQAVDFDDLLRLPVSCSRKTTRSRSAGAAGSGMCWWMNTRTPIAPSTACCNC
jgi:ATP-dependent DNA helicase Rep